jgi:phenylacetate-CoA ligase
MTTLEMQTVTPYQRFLEASSAEHLADYTQASDPHWQACGEQFALTLFHAMAARVPAYRTFLARHDVDPHSIQTIQDFQRLPLMDKPNYIDQYRLADLCWDGRLDGAYAMAASSGSTGTSYYWPRFPEQTAQGAQISELIYREFFGMGTRSTLYLVTFAMGTWIAGAYMAMATQWVGQKGYPVTTMTPGINKAEILRIVRQVSPHYDQTVMIGLPPFVKDVIDSGLEEGLNWRDYNLRFMFSGEAFTERWRSHLCAKTGLKNILTDAINIYGSADVGLIAHETPVTIFARRQAAESPEILRALFQADRVPSVHQYNPTLRYFEQVGGELVVTARSGLPLLRYNMKDVGGILRYGDLLQTLQAHGVDLEAEFAAQKASQLLWRLPLVYLLGRGKFSATLYGITLFPEYVKYVLDHDRLEGSLSGKFVITTEETKQMQQQLHLRVELSARTSRSPELARQVTKTFIQELPKVSSEYRHLLASVGRQAHPKVFLHAYGDPAYFPQGPVKKTS